MSEHIHVNTFVCCEKIIEEARTRNKTIVGVFRNFNFQELPARFGTPWFIFAQIANLDPGKHDITINVVHDETQGVVFAAGLEVPEEHTENVDLAVQASQTRFQKAGKHVVTLNVDGSHVAYFVLSVNLKPMQVGGK